MLMLGRVPHSLRLKGRPTNSLLYAKIFDDTRNKRWCFHTLEFFDEIYAMKLSNVCYQEHRHGVLFGGTDSWAHKPTYPQNLFSNRISATLFGKFWKMQNFNTCKEKVTEIS